jgi:hypothetical protein
MARTVARAAEPPSRRAAEPPSRRAPPSRPGPKRHQESKSPRREAEGSWNDVAIDAYFTKPFVWSQALATAAMSFLSTDTCLPRSVRVAVSILADRSLRIFSNEVLSTLAR